MVFQFVTRSKFMPYFTGINTKLPADADPTLIISLDTSLLFYYSFYSLIFEIQIVSHSLITSGLLRKTKYLGGHLLAGSTSSRLRSCFLPPSSSVLGWSDVYWPVLAVFIAASL
jgi:hypothetical protein